MWASSIPAHITQHVPPIILISNDQLRNINHRPEWTFPGSGSCTRTYGYGSDLFNELKEMDPEEKKDRYPSLVAELEILTSIYGEMANNMTQVALKAGV